jgi:hypothetical protein
VSRWGGFRTGKRVFSQWETRRSPSASTEEAPESVQDFDYTTAQGIWNLRSTTQFSKTGTQSVTWANITGSKGSSGDITLPAITSNQMIVVMERADSSTPPATLAGFTSIITNNNTTRNRSMRVQYRIGGEEETINTPASTMYAVLNNAKTIGETATFSGTSSSNPLPIPAISNLNTDGNSLIFATAYLTTTIIGAGTPYTAVNGIGAYIENNLDENLSQNTFTINAATFHISVAIEFRP